MACHLTVNQASLADTVGSIPTRSTSIRGQIGKVASFRPRSFVSSNLTGCTKLGMAELDAEPYKALAEVASNGGHAGVNPAPWTKIERRLYEPR